MYIIYYSNRSYMYIQNIGPDFCVQGCDIAQAREGYIRSYILYIGPV